MTRNASPTGETKLSNRARQLDPIVAFRGLNCHPSAGLFLCTLSTRIIF